jgi:glutamine synthetase
VLLDGGDDASQEVTDAIVAALEAQSIQLEQYYVELGHGQQELSVVHLPVLEAADTQILVRETIRAVASSFGLVASLAPKPWPDQAGNGAHVHFSVWDPAGDRNLFHDGARRYALSEIAERFGAGILAHTPGLLALTAPSFNSFRRLLPQHWSSAFVCWGPDNREATVRVPSTFWGLEEPSANLEFKPSDASCNPYIAFAGLIAAGLDGIERGLGLPEPMWSTPRRSPTRNASVPGPSATPRRSARPSTRLERDEVLTGAMGDLLTASYLAVRRSEFEAYGAMDEAEQYRGHFAKY